MTTTERHGSRVHLLARGGALSLVGSVVTGILAFALVVVVTRTLHPGGAGAFFEAVALFTIISNTAELGADTGLVREVSQSVALGRVQELRTVFRVAMWPVLIISSLVAVIVAVFAPQLAHVFVHGHRRSDWVRYVRALMPFVPAAAGLSVLQAASRGYGVMGPHVLENVAVAALRPALVAMSVALGFGAVAIALSWGSPLALGFAIAVLVLLAQQRQAERRNTNASSPMRSRRRLAIDFWRFSAPRGLAGFFAITVVWLDVLLVGAFLTARSAGVYAAASRFAVAGLLALGAISLAFAPHVSGLLAKGDRAGAEELFRTATAWLILLSWPLYLVCAIFAPVLMSVFGPGFAAGGTALLILSLGMLPLVGSGNNKIVLLMGGGSGWNLFSACLALVVNVGLNVILIPRLGINGAAVAWAASILIDNVVITVLVWRLLGIHPFGRAFQLSIAATMGCFGVVPLAVRSTVGPSAAGLAVAVLLGGAIYILILARLRRSLQLSQMREAIAAGLTRQRARTDRDADAAGGGDDARGSGVMVEPLGREG